MIKLRLTIGLLVAFVVAIVAGTGLAMAQAPTPTTALTGTYDAVTHTPAASPLNDERGQASARVASRAADVSTGISVRPPVGVVAAETAPGAVRVTISRSRYPESAGHIEDAQAAGQPSVLTIDRAGAAARRTESMRGNPRVPGLDRDEYPPAMTSEGGTGSSVRPINPGDNRGAGSCIGLQCRGLLDGTQIQLGVDP